MSQYIKTYGRIRPSARGTDASALISSDKTVKIETENGQKAYELHRIFNSDATQEDVFSCVSKKIVEDSAEGFNGTIFAYGQTGSGKTHTMLGPCNSWSDSDRKGLIPRSIEYLFQLLDKKAQECQKFTFAVNVEFVELYNEEIFDLLNSKNKVQLRDSGKDIQLVGAKAENVDNSLDLMHVVERGWQSRSTGSTAMNIESSRSHALLIIKINTQEVTGGLVKERYSTLNLVDLAGSERQSHTKASGDRLKEATNINSSLTVLGRCIRILSKPSPGNTYVPYRDSHLTHILKNSLGGNSKTAVIVNMHPDREFVAESSSTLLFAQSCTMIKNAVTRNEVMSGDQENSYKKAIQELRREVDEARAKAREEFAEKLEGSEEQQRRLTAENDSLKSDKNDLRAKYNLALAKYSTGVQNDDLVNEFKKLYLGNVHDGVSLDLQDLVAKNQTLQLECDASEKRCHQLQQELNDVRNRYKDNLNTTIQMQTPNAKERRSSTRSKRRETQYKPSPGRLAELAENDVEQQVLEANTRIQQLELEVQQWRTRWEEEVEKTSETERKDKEEIGKLKKQVTDVSKRLEQSEADVDALVRQVGSCEATLNTLLVTVNEHKKTITALEESKKDVEDKLNKEINDMRDHYIKQLKEREIDLSNVQKELSEKSHEIATLQKQFSTKSELVTTLKQNLNEKSQKIEVLQQEFNKKSAEIISLQQGLNEKSQRVVDLEKELNTKSKSIDTLQQSLNEKSQKTDGLQKDFRDKSEEINNLQQELNKKSQRIAGLQKELSDMRAMSAILQNELSEKTETSSILEKELKTKSQLIDSLEREIVKKGQLIGDQEAQLEKNIVSLSDFNSAKRKLEELQENEEHLKKMIEDHKNARQAQFNEHQRDLRTLREKKEQEIKSIQRSLDMATKIQKEQELNFKKQQNEEKRKFDEKCCSMDKQFKEMHADALKKQEDKIKRESLNQMESALYTKENKIRELEEIKEKLEKQHHEDTDLIANKLNTKQQKLSYVAKLRTEKLDQEEILAQQRTEIARLSKGHRESNRPVLRSRNAPQ